MGKGFNNYMCKKFFHPASADNLKRVWIAQKKADTEKKKQDELRTQYDREQELYNNKALLSKETKEKLELNFMYELPPGMKKEGGEEGGEDGKEPEYKFEWQRTWGHAPKESYLEKGDDFNEQPFGIQVCQAKCIKCGKFGHMNTDKRCPLYGRSIDHDAPIQSVDQNKLIDEMKADGMAMRYTSWELKREAGPNHKMVEEERGVDRVELLKTMSKDEKKKLLKKLKKMEKKQKKKDKKDKKKKRKSSSNDSDDSDEWEEKGAAAHDSPNKEHNKKRNRSRSRDAAKSSPKDAKEKRSSRSRSRERRRDRSSSRERRRDRSGSRERRRDRSGSRERRKRDRSDSRDRNKRRERSVSRDDRKERSRRDRHSSREEKRERRHN